jgi:hypothetical protein
VQVEVVAVKIDGVGTEKFGGGKVTESAEQFSVFALGSLH